MTFGEERAFKQPCAIILGDIASIKDGFRQRLLSVENIDESVQQYTCKSRLDLLRLQKGKRGARGTQMKQQNQLANSGKLPNLEIPK